MLTKYYVRSGLITELVLAYSPMQACIKAFQRVDGPSLCGGCIYVSQRGFKAHEDDHIYTTEGIFRLMYLAANGEDDQTAKWQDG